MNTPVLDLIFVLILLLNFFMLAAHRLRATIYASACQGVLLGIAFPLAHVGASAPLSLVAGGWVDDARVIALAVVMIGMKGYIIPWMLLRAKRQADVARKVDSVVGLMPALLLGALGTGLVLAFAGRLPLKVEHAHNLLVPTSLATVLTGFLLLMTVRQALVQVLGYVVLENGIFIFGLLLIDAFPDIVEIGVLLDLFVGVFVMGIIIHHVSRAFPSASSEHLSELKE